MKPFLIKRSKSINQCTSVLLGMGACEAGIGSRLGLWSSEGALKASSLWKWQSKATKGMWEQKRSVGGKKSTSCQLIVQRLLSLTINEADTEIS